MICVNETATFDILIVAATWPIVCATATYEKKIIIKLVAKGKSIEVDENFDELHFTGNRAFQNSRSVSGAWTILKVHDTSIINDPVAKARVETSQGNGKAFKTFLL